jgi:transcriptional regulator with XRE-family HTH domain
MARTSAKSHRASGGAQSTAVHKPHPVDIHVGSRVRMRRILLGLTQMKLAARIGISFQALQKYEKGVIRVSASRLQRLAETMDVPVSYFFEGADAPESAPTLRPPHEPRTASDRQLEELCSAFIAIKDDELRSSVLHLLQRTVEAIPDNRRSKRRG